MGLVLLGSVVCYGGLCFEQCSVLLLWAVFCWAVQYVVTVVCVLSNAVCYGELFVVGQWSMLFLWVCLMERGLVIVMLLN